MKLEQFREIADENLSDLVADERMLQRVHQKMAAVTCDKKNRVPRRAIAFAAACAAVMVISGGVLAATTDLVNKPQQDAAKPEPIMMQQTAGSVSKLSAHADTSLFIDGTSLPYGILEIGQYCEGYAPAVATNGLHGYVDVNGVWIVKAKYDSAMPVENGKAVVKKDGLEQIIEIPAA